MFYAPVDIDEHDAVVDSISTEGIRFCRRLGSESNSLSIASISSIICIGVDSELKRGGESKIFGGESNVTGVMEDCDVRSK